MTYQEPKPEYINLSGWLIANYTAISTVLPITEIITNALCNCVSSKIIFICSFILYVLCVVLNKRTDKSVENLALSFKDLCEQNRYLREYKDSLAGAARELISDKLHDIARNLQLGTNDIVTFYVLEEDCFIAHSKRNARAVHNSTNTAHHKDKGFLGKLYNANADWLYDGNFPSALENYIIYCENNYQMSREDVLSLRFRFLVYYGYVVYNNSKHKAGILLVETNNKVSTKNRENVKNKLKEYAIQIEKVFNKFQECENVFKQIDC